MKHTPIAAAPDLLEACIKGANLLYALCKHDTEIFKLMRKAIQKAGE